MRLRFNRNKLFVSVLIMFFIFAPNVYGEESQAGSKSYNTVQILDAFAEALGHNSGSPEKDAAYIMSISPEAKAAGAAMDYLTVAKIGNQLLNTSGETIAAKGAIRAFEDTVGPGFTDMQTSEQAAAFLQENLKMEASPQATGVGEVITPLETMDVKSPIEDANAAGVAAANELDQMGVLSHQDLIMGKGDIVGEALGKVESAAQEAVKAAIEAEEAKKSGDETADEKKKVADQKKDEADKAVKKAAEVIPDKTDKIQDAAKRGTETAVKNAQDKGVPAETVVVADQVKESLTKVADDTKKDVVNNELTKQDKGPADTKPETPVTTTEQPAPDTTTTPEPSEPVATPDVTVDTTEVQNPVIDTPRDKPDEVSTSQ